MLSSSKALRFRRSIITSTGYSDAPASYSINTIVDWIDKGRYRIEVTEVPPASPSIQDGDLNYTTKKDIRPQFKCFARGLVSLLPTVRS